MSAYTAFPYRRAKYNENIRDRKFIYAIQVKYFQAESEASILQDKKSGLKRPLFLL